MKKPLIGITVGEIINEAHPWSPVVLGQGHTYIDSIVHAGGVPIIIPLCDDESAIKALYELCDGLLMTGGNDVDPNLYNAKRSKLTVDISPNRDTQETKLLSWAEEDDKPMLAICRGMQLFNVYKGGTLYQDIETERPNSSNHHLSTDVKSIVHVAHQLEVNPLTHLGKIVGTDPLPTNTHHHQGIRKLGKGLVENAWAEDGVVEGLEASNRKFAIGVQSHPESLESGEPRWRALFISLIEHANRYKAQN